MNLAYQSLRCLVKPIQWCTMPATVLHAERLAIDGPCIIAPTHISHLEPFVVSMLVKREVRWMARTEFYKFLPFKIGLDVVGAFPVHRQGYARPSMREALRLLSEGEQVGVFPEAGVSRRQYSAMRGGPIKHGAAYLAVHGRVPIVPLAVVGTHAMNRVAPWRPFRHAAVYMAVGEPIVAGPMPQTPGGKRTMRHELSEQMRDAYQALYRELLALDGVDDRHDLHPGESDDPSAVKVDPYAAAGDARVEAT